ncbi:choice-of-anchor B family protein [Planctomycetes bacterium Poly30]|uniref:choice-of-anchor B family protein n=1 Tax=Saltatorellus ferox TaxID=2528018 RepID=UPI00119E3430
MKTSLPTHLAAAATLVFFALSGSIFAHEDDPKLLNMKPPVAGSGYIRGLAAGAILPGGGSNRGTQAGSGFDSHEVTLHSWLSIADLGGTNLNNDIWGYVSPSGREYALVGAERATIIVEVTNPDLPTIVGSIPGPSSIWRDIRTYTDRAYSVTEAGDGIQVIDLSSVDAGIVTLERTVTTGGSTASHNVVVDTDSGFLYRCGGSGHGLRIYDLSNPGNPTYVATWDDRYVHDAQVVTYTSGPYAGKEIAFCCSGFNSGWVDPGLSVLDVTNKQNIVQLAQVSYPGGVYSHQGALSEDRQLFYLGDELDEDGSIDTTTHVFDVSNLTGTTYTGAFTNGSRAVGHNMFTANGHLYQANYNDGLRIFDATTNPSSPVEVAYFDTAPTSSAADYNGMWGVYPYLPSGTLLCNDRQRGLFVLTHDPSLGQTYCQASANSTGQVSTVQGTGSRTVADNDVSLTATQLPQNAVGYFIVSNQQGYVTNPAGSSGNLCLGGALGRYVGQASSSGSAGEIPVQVNVNQVPQPLGAVAIQPGETWNFQCWHRDAVLGIPTSNFSEGYAITFQ